MARVSGKTSTSVFVDSGHWIALLDPAEVLHKRAREEEARSPGRLHITSEAVLIEVLNFFSGLGPDFRERAVQFVRALREDLTAEIVPQTPALFDEAVLLYQQRPDKEWGLTDCISFVIMKQRGLTEALAHDKHFVQAGFGALLRD